MLFTPQPVNLNNGHDDVTSKETNRLSDDIKLSIQDRVSKESVHRTVLMSPIIPQLKKKVSI